MKKLVRSACFTDIHFGGRSNSEMHNLDCYEFVQWFCEKVKQDKKIDHICFLGDWFDNRSSINVATLNHSHNAAQLINDLGLPVYFIVGNHDIYHRHTRDVHSSRLFADFENFRVIDRPQVIKEIGEGAFFTPYLFHNEYEMLVEQNAYKTWWGHFEFQGFVITGSDIRMPTGPNADDFKGPKFIFSGHFHKRQAYNNIVYIGNAFPTNFNDAGDHDRGMMIFDHKTDDVEFINWEQCPKFIKTKLSKLLDDSKILLPNARVKCEIDVPIDYEESAYIRDRFCKRHKLREMILEPSATVKESITGTKVEMDNTTLMSVDDMVIEMLSKIDNENINKSKLIEMYRELEID